MKVYLTRMAVLLHNGRFKRIRLCMPGRHAPEFGHDDVRINVVVGARTDHSCMVYTYDARPAQGREMFSQFCNEGNVFGIHQRVHRLAHEVKTSPGEHTTDNKS